MLTDEGIMLRSIRLRKYCFFYDYGSKYSEEISIDSESHEIVEADVLSKNMKLQLKASRNKMPLPKEKFIALPVLF